MGLAHPLRTENHRNSHVQHLQTRHFYVAVSGLCEVLGQVDVADSTQLTRKEWHSFASAHRLGSRTNPNELLLFPSPPPHAWHLSNAIRYTNPIPMDRPQGPVMWVKLAPMNQNVPPAGKAPAGSQATSPSAVPGGGQPASDPPGTGDPPDPPIERLRQAPDLARGRAGPDDDTGARASLTMAILLQHQDQIRTAMQLANHPPSMAEGASALIVNLNQYHREPQCKKKRRKRWCSAVR